VFERAGDDIGSGETADERDHGQPDAAACSLSDILEMSAPAKYYLRPRACRWDTPSSREKRQAIAERTQNRTGIAGGDCLTPWDTQ
jgi:hypothetical protein